jgi:hypothetical protein
MVASGDARGDKKEQQRTNSSANSQECLYAYISHQ